MNKNFALDDRTKLQLSNAADLLQYLTRIIHEIGDEVIVNPPGVGPMKFSYKEIQEAAWLCEYLGSVTNIICREKEA